MNNQILLSEKKIVFKRHRYLYDRPSYGGVVSCYYKCAQCGDVIPGGGEDGYAAAECYKMERKYAQLFLKWEYDSICSMEQRNRALLETKATIMNFVRTYHTKHELLYQHICGTTSIASEAVESLIAEGSLILDFPKIYLKGSYYFWKRW